MADAADDREDGADEDIERKIADLERRRRRRRPAIATLTIAPAIVVGAIVVGFLVMAQDARRDLKILNKELAEKQQAVFEARAAEAALQEEIKKEKEELLELVKEKREMAAYVERLRAALDPGGAGAESVPLQEEGAIPLPLRNAIKPRARATPRATADGEVIDVDLWIEVPAGSADAIASVSYDLDARYYRNNHFMNDSQRLPQKPAKLTVLGCESKVLTTVKLKQPGASLTIDFDWCKATKWPPRVRPPPEPPVMGMPLRKGLETGPAERPMALPRAL